MIFEAASTAYQKGDLPSSEFPEVEIEEPKAASHGDFSTNIAMKMASSQKMPPRKISEMILDCIDDRDHILEKTDIAGPGFMNFFLTPSAWYPILKTVHAQGEKYGASDIGRGQRVLLLDQLDFILGGLILGLIVYVPSIVEIALLLVLTPSFHLLGNKIAFRTKRKKVSW